MQMRTFGPQNNGTRCLSATLHPTTRFMLAYLFSAIFFFLAPTSATTDDPKTPVVEWLTEQDHDFGQVRSGKTVRFMFKYKNLAAEPLLLQTVRTSCGCTAAEWTQEPVDPGATGQVLIEFESSQQGDFRKKIRVFFDKQRKPEILWIEGEVN